MVEGSEIGAYRVIQRIGEGGMGSVWLAEHAMLGRRAAIKVLHTEFSNRPEIVTRFFNEARAATAIADPGIVQIFDFGHHVDGSAYIVMELLDGEPLDKRLSRVGALDVPGALRIMRQVASTLGAAHARGIVHRDLKPENIFVVRDPEVSGGERAKVLDFGIAKLSSDHSGVKTQTTAVMGTPMYMSPEQCRGAGHVDQRSDVYALGCVLFALLTGRPPFDAEGIGEIIAMHLREPAPVPSQLRPGIPPEVDRIVLRCLEKDPAMRFTSAADLAIAIGAVTGSSPYVAVPSGVHAAHAAQTTLSLTASAGTAPGTRRSNRSLLFGAAGTVVVLAGAAVFVARSRTGHTSQDAPPEATTRQSPDGAGDQPPAQLAAAAGSAENVRSHGERASAPQTPPDTAQDTAAEMKLLLEHFVAWARDHAGAPCPEASTLGASTDGWGHPYRITCSEQPRDQIIGVISAGLDGVFETTDDIRSWNLGHEVTDVVRGSRWVVATPPAAPVTPAVKKHSGSVKTGRSVSKPVKPGGDIEFDENGLPISR
jgi:serine/threonine-protein kinase